MSRTTVDRGEYRTRSFDPDDAAAFLDLYEDVWGVRKSADWFRWRFAENPHVDEVPMVLATHGSDLVGAEPNVVFRLRAGESDRIAYMPADWMVHPDHRRRGVFTSMTESLLDRYADGPPALYFNFPSDDILPGLRKFDWRVVGSTPTFYRIQRPRAVANHSLAGGKRTARVGRAVGSVAGPLARGYLATLDHLPSRRGGSVARHEGTPSRTLAALYERTAPDRIHVVRDRSFYDWRFANPRWDVRTYVTRRDGRPAGSLTVAEETNRGCRIARILDVLPMDGTASDAVYRSLLEAAVADSGHADLLTYAGQALAPRLLGRFGFHPDDSLPLSLFSEQSRMVVRPAARAPEEPYRIAGRALVDPSNWLLSVADQDVG
ncbi:MAG: GNAT family N-acetyltransferase [Haloferacaceae archaeon]